MALKRLVKRRSNLKQVRATGLRVCLMWNFATPRLKVEHRVNGL